MRNGGSLIAAALIESTVRGREDRETEPAQPETARATVAPPATPRKRRRLSSPLSSSPVAYLSAMSEAVAPARVPSAPPEHGDVQATACRHRRGPSPLVRSRTPSGVARRGASVTVIRALPKDPAANSGSEAPMRSPRSRLAFRFEDAFASVIIAVAISPASRRASQRGTRRGGLAPRAFASTGSHSRSRCGLVVDDVANASPAMLDRGRGRRRGVINMNVGGDAVAVVDDREPTVVRTGAASGASGSRLTAMPERAPRRLAQPSALPWPDPGRPSPGEPPSGDRMVGVGAHAVGNAGPIAQSSQRATNQQLWLATPAHLRRCG